MGLISNETHSLEDTGDSEVFSYKTYLYTPLLFCSFIYIKHYILQENNKYMNL